MGHQPQASESGIWRSGDGSRAWLSMLVDAMENAARPEIRAVPCDGVVLAALRAQLSRPSLPYSHHGSRFSLRN
jgi:hypothetical protein